MDLEFRILDKDNQEMIKDVWIAPQYGWLVMSDNDVLSERGRENNDNFIWMLYTGMKARNKKVYDGDLLSYDCGDDDTELCEVKYLNGRFVTQRIHSGTIDEVPYQTIKLAKVVGNIYKNPKLLIPSKNVSI